MNESLSYGNTDQRAPIDISHPKALNTMSCSQPSMLQRSVQLAHLGSTIGVFDFVVEDIVSRRICPLVESLLAPNAPPPFGCRRLCKKTRWEWFIRASTTTQIHHKRERYFPWVITSCCGSKRELQRVWDGRKSSLAFVWTRQHWTRYLIKTYTFSYYSMYFYFPSCDAFLNHSYLFTPSA